jgi:hypothetical protein
MGTFSGFPPYPAPPGYQWIYCAQYKHARSKKLMVAKEYGYSAWCFLVRKKRG